MSRFEIDDQFLGHHKVKRALRSGAEALQMWLAMRTYVAINNTGGFIPDEDLDDLNGKPGTPRKWVAVLVNCGKPLPNGGRGAGLVDEVPGGWELHDYSDHGLSPEEIEHKRKLSRDRQRRWRRTRMALPERDVTPPTNPVSNASTDALGDGSDPIRSDPVDTIVSTLGLDAPAKNKKAQPKFRITPDWLPTQARLDAIAEKTGVSQDALLRQVPEFRLYWLPGGKGASRKDAVKRSCDWDQSFSNRIDQLIEWGKLTVTLPSVASLPCRQLKIMTEDEAVAKINASKQIGRF